MLKIDNLISDKLNRYFTIAKSINTQNKFDNILEKL